MTPRHAQAAWTAFFAATGGAALVLSVSLVVSLQRPLVALLWFLGAAASVAWIRADDLTSELRFTREGGLTLGWLAVFFLPPLGAAIGIVLRARGSSQGVPMILTSLAIFAAALLASHLGWPQ